MKINDFFKNAYVQTYNARDKLYLRRMLQIWLLYWVGALLMSALLPTGAGLESSLPLAHFVIKRFDGIMQAVERSFDPAYMAVFIAFCLCWSVALSLLTLVWSPKGSHLTFISWRHKVAYVLLSIFALSVSWLILMVPQTSEFSLGNGRTSARMFIGTTSRIGAGTALAFMWGFGQLFVFQALQIILRSPVQKSFMGGPSVRNF